jgi:hypothetical protein
VIFCGQKTWVPRGWNEADRAAAARDFLSDKPHRRSAVRDLIDELLSPDPFARRCAADLARRVSEREPGILKTHADVLIDMAARLPDQEWQTCGYAAMAAAHNTATAKLRLRLAGLLRAMACSPRVGLRAMAVESFAHLAAAEPKLRGEALNLLKQARSDPAYAVRIRARRMLPLLAPDAARGHEENFLRKMRNGS